MTSIHSIWPEAFTERIRKQFPDTAGSFLESLTNDARVSVRINPAKFRETIDEEKIPWCSAGYFLDERPLFALDPLWHAGAYYVQEASSMFMEQVFGQVKKEHPLLVLDLCAAPGGKSTHLCSLLGKDDLIVSNEVIRSRVPVLMENICKWGYSNTLVSSSDAKEFGNAGALFDVLIIDAPCSGEGLFRRFPEAALEWSAENAALCALRQRRILTDSWACLKEGGYLIYSTCTFNPAENEENLHWLRSQSKFRSVRVPLNPDWKIDEVEYEGIYGYRFLPSSAEGEGFFIALIHKNEETPPFRFPSRFRTKLQKLSQIPAGWINQPEAMRIFGHRNQVKFFPVRWEAEILYLFDAANVLKAGTTAGQLIRNEVLPDHELAMSLEMNQDAFPKTELSCDDALKYLAREQFSLNPDKASWQLITFRKIPLGFIKNLGNRFNNYYPTSRRLRMQFGAPVDLWYDKRK